MIWKQWLRSRSEEKGTFINPLSKELDRLDDMYNEYYFSDIDKINTGTVTQSEAVAIKYVAKNHVVP